MLSGLRKIAASGEHESAIEKAREGLSDYPNSFKLMLFFAEEIYLYNHMTPENERDANKDTALSYLEQILENCTDTSIRNRAHTTLCLWYAELGRTEEAETLAKEKESSFTSGELLARIYKGTKRFEVLRTEVEGQFFHAVAYNFAGLIKSKYDDGTPVYSDDEKLAMHQMAIDMIKMFIPDKDYCFFAQFIETHYTNMADIYAKKQDRERTLEYLSNAAAFAVEFDSYDENTVHTSLALRGMVAGGRWWHDCHNRSYDLIEELRGERYSFLHGDSEFKNIIERLSNTAK